MHVHAFSPLEVWHGAGTLGLSVPAYLERLRNGGLASLPGTAAEILDDPVRAVICPDKVSAGAWLKVVESAHGVGLRTTATIMFGHVEAPRHGARHLLLLRRLQARTGGITEFVPLPFVPMEAPLYRKGRTRRGPTSGKPCSCTPSPDWPCIRTSPTSRPRGSSWARKAPPPAFGPGQRPGRHPDEREHQPRRRRRPRPGDVRRGHGAPDPRARPQAPAAHHPLRAGRADEAVPAAAPRPRGPAPGRVPAAAMGVGAAAGWDRASLPLPGGRTAPC